MEELVAKTIWSFKLIVKKENRIETLHYWKTHQEFIPILLFFEKDPNFEIVKYTAKIDDTPF